MPIIKNSFTLKELKKRRKIVINQIIKIPNRQNIKSIEINQSSLKDKIRIFSLRMIGFLFLFFVVTFSYR
jgi:hypothetical protein